MSLADNIFIEMCNDVIANGTSTEGEKVRPVWEDGTPAYTIKRFAVVNRYDLRKELTPIISTTFTAISGTAGQMKMVLLERRMAISLESNISIKKG